MSPEVKQVYRRWYKTAAPRSPNGITKTKKINKIQRKTIFNMADGILLPCNVARDSGITWRWIRQVAAPYNVAHGSGMTSLNLPSDSTLQCDTWLWVDMPLSSPKRPPHLNSTSGFDFDHITAVDMSFCTSLLNFIQIGPWLLGVQQLVLWKSHVTWCKPYNFL